jgi:hypothetical protein
MKVHIGPYREWLGPYQLAEKICFWVKPVKGEHGFPTKPKWVHKFGEWLAHGSILPEERVGEEFFVVDSRSKTRLYKFLLWISSKKKSNINVHIDEWDCWSMDITLGHIIRPMLYKMRECKRGSPFVLDEDVPEHLRSTAVRSLTQEEKDTGHTDENYHARWEWVLDEMIFAFDSLEGGPNQDWEDQFTTGEYDFRFKKISEDGTSMLVQGPNHTAETNWEARKKYAERVQNGFSLFGKYYQSLWT